MKIANYILASALALPGLSCSRGHDRLGRTDASPGANCAATAWDDKKPGDSAQLRRLESVTWDSVKHELAWDVSKGEKKSGAYQPQSKDHYEISMDNATMTVNGESRRFSEDEAANVRALMDFISRYALESTVWWENGEGDPVDDRGTPARPRRQTPQIPGSGGKAKAIQIKLIGSPAL